ncbi:MAG: nicotinate phosphoribosyltransferase [Acidimicrobiales bacterium]
MMSLTGSRQGASTALLTDHYELTMLQAAIESGVAGREAVFEVFARSLPAGRRYGVVAGTARLVEAIASFRFGEAELEALSRAGWLAEATLSWLAGYRFGGSVDAYAEGELHFPFSPVLRVRSTFAEGLLLETISLSILNHDSAVASAAARMASAAGGRVLIEMGSRRTHEEAAVAAARAAYIAGFAATSNLEAGRRYGIPTVGTSSHAFTLAHTSEEDAFRAQVAALGTATTLLVDTFDIEQGIRTAVAVAGTGLGAVRIDSGELVEEVRRARKLLDQLGARETRIVVSGDLDEYAIEELGQFPADSYGVGTRVVSGSGAPSANFVYKLVAIADGETGAASERAVGGEKPGRGLRAVAKRSFAKQHPGGSRDAFRLVDGEGFAVGEVLVDAASDRPAEVATLAPAWRRSGALRARPLLQRVVEAGEGLPVAGLAECREHHARSMAELRPQHRSVSAGRPAMAATPEQPSMPGAPPG